jgi:enoyl-CoA hydratase
MLPRAVGAQRAAEILLTSRPVLADEAERIGLVLRAVPDERLLDEALGIARSIMQNVPLGIWLTKQSLWLNQNVGSLQAAIELEARAIPLAQSTADAAEKRSSFLEKRPPVFGNK